MNFIKSIIEGKTDNLAHKQLARYGKGSYEKAYVTIKGGKSSFNVKTSFEFANDFVGIIAENAKSDLDVSGKIIANYDFDKELGIEHEFSKRGKLYSATINARLNPEDLGKIYERFSASFLLLNIKGGNLKLSVKNTLPKPGGSLKGDFCNATLPLDLMDEFAFDVKQNFASLKIKHIYVIDELIVSDECKDDFLKARELAKRKGKVIRILDIDGKIEERSYNLLV